MRLPRKFLKFDYWVHILFGVLIGLCIVLIPLYKGTSLVALAWLWFIIGVWQVFSALVMTLGYRNKKRLYYLLAVVLYLSIFLLTLQRFPFSEYFIFLSLGFAVWYAYITYKDATYRKPSFWDLEF